MRSSFAALRALVVAAHIASPLALPGVSFAAASAAHGLPAPQVSRALDAVLLPIDKTVAKKFHLAKGTRGVLVLSVKPGGIADKQGIRPGDVLSKVRGHAVRKPIDVDISVGRSLKAGHSDIALDLLRDGAPLALVTVVTLESYEESISVTEVSSWESYSAESSFSYSDYVSEESQSIETAYESEETTVEQAMLEEETVGEEATDEATDEADADDDASEDTADASDEDGDGDDGDDGDSGDDGDGGDDGDAGDGGDDSEG